MRPPLVDLIGQRFLLRQAHCAHLTDRHYDVIGANESHASGSENRGRFEPNQLWLSPILQPPPFENIKILMLKSARHGELARTREALALSDYHFLANEVWAF